jgi:hypothetical protein
MSIDNKNAHRFAHAFIEVKPPSRHSRLWDVLKPKWYLYTSSIGFVFNPHDCSSPFPGFNYIHNTAIIVHSRSPAANIYHHDCSIRFPNC